MTVPNVQGKQGLVHVLSANQSLGAIVITLHSLWWTLYLDWKADTICCEVVGQRSLQATLILLQCTLILPLQPVHTFVLTVILKLSRML